jgi:protein-tyrosine phosphatase
MQWITLDGAVNVRDVGGMPTDDGSLTVTKRLLRADNLQGLSEADVSRLIEGFGLSRVIDLRTIGEVRSEGPGPLAAFAAVEHVNYSLLIVDDLEEEALNESLLTDRRRRAAAADPDHAVSIHYLKYLEHRPDSIVAALRAIADAPGAALVHCAAGKDRTGVVVALALVTVGVRRDAVVADYAATAERIDAILARLRASATYVNNVDKITTEQHTPRAAAMGTFLDLIETRHGSVPDWLAGQGFGADDVERLRRRLLSV